MIRVKVLDSAVWRVKGGYAYEYKRAINIIWMDLNDRLRRHIFIGGKSLSKLKLQTLKRKTQWTQCSLLWLQARRPPVRQHWRILNIFLVGIPSACLLFSLSEHTHTRFSFFLIHHLTLHTSYKSSKFYLIASSLLPIFIYSAKVQLIAPACKKLCG